MFRPLASPPPPRLAGIPGFSRTDSKYGKVPSLCLNDGIPAEILDSSTRQRPGKAFYHLQRRDSSFDGLRARGSAVPGSQHVRRGLPLHHPGPDLGGVREVLGQRAGAAHMPLQGTGNPGGLTGAVPSVDGAVTFGWTLPFGATVGAWVLMYLLNLRIHWLSYHLFVALVSFCR